MGKSGIKRKRNVSIVGILNVDRGENSILVELENGEARELGEVLEEFDGAEVSMSITESFDLA